MKRRDSILAPKTGWSARLPSRLSRLLAVGTAGSPAGDRSYLIATNVTGFLATLSSLSYALTYAIQDFANLQMLVYGNLVSATLTASVPLFHRFGRIAGGLLLTVTIFSTIFYFTAVVGREAGIQLNYLGAAAIAFLVLGIERLWLVAGVVSAAAILHLAAWFLFPVESAQVAMPPAFLSQVYAFSALSIMAIITLVVYYVFQLLQHEQARSNALLLNIMPDVIAEQLKADPDSTIAEQHEHATVLFADLTGFTPLAGKLGPQKIVALLDELFSAFDAEVARIGVEKIKTIGDAYMVVSGAPVHRPDHAEAIAELALAMLAATHMIALNSGHNLRMRIGIATGPVMAGVIGRTKFAYDVWGETVNRAARLEAYGEPGAVLIDEPTATILTDRFRIVSKGEIDLKGLGPTATWTLRDRKLH
ncbi:MAG: adenylate/guanylate cyclase domain-containing protein [Hyphomicrobiales bacterium]|nr:adenylate/guanylate cyclase domain-containing protein [Hyphomicrobiales bacterium]